MTWRVFRRALVVIVRNRLRSTLIVLSAALGVAGVILLTGYADEGSRALLEQIRRMGVNVLIVVPKSSRAVAGRARTAGNVTTLVERDYAAVRRRVKGIARTSAVVSGNFLVQSGDLSKNANVIGCEPAYFAIKDWPLAEGEGFSARRGAREVLLGVTIARNLFGGAPARGRQLRINRIPFTVTGVLSERGQGLDVGNEDEQVYIPLMTAMRRLLNTDHYSSLVIEMSSETNGETNSEGEGASAITTLLRAQHRTDDFDVQNQKTLIETQRAAATRLRWLVDSIAAAALAVSSAGILGISVIAVRQRTRELGTLRALGASARNVFVQLFAETLTLAVAGALLGLAAARVASTRMPFAVPALASSIALNLGCALIPARRAAGVDPVEALRYE